MLVEVFSKRIQAYLRASGYDQKQLAMELGLHYKVLSRKFHGTTNSYLSHREIHDMLFILIEWQAITKYDDLLSLFAEAEIDASAIFSAAEWQAVPLKQLTRPVSLPPFAQESTLQHNLPAPLGKLIGRSWATIRLQQLLGQQEIRLVTLIGPGGSGKTRLALHVARELLSTFAQGVWFISFNGVNDPALVPFTIAQGLNMKSLSGESTLQSLITYLHQRQILLILDNFEHMGEACDVVEDLLTALPALKVLITSRIVLHIPGEYEFSVPPLDLPDPDSAPLLDAGSLGAYGAVQLFVERAQAVLPTFALTDQNSSAIAQICACVDGLPLALELAAARIKILPPESLLERLLQARLPLLSRASRSSSSRSISSRHQTLSDTIKWSYDLLTPEEQAWFRRLGVFVGGWALEASEMMIREISASTQQAFTEFSPLDLLTRLVNNSLLTRVDNARGYARFNMLSTLREYVLARLEAHNESEMMRDWHAYFYLRKTEMAELGLRGPRQLLMVRRITDARANVRAALEWSLSKAQEGKLIQSFAPQTLPQEVANSRTLSRQAFPARGLSAHEVSLRIATAMRAYWEWQGLLMEARYWLNAALAIPFDAQAGPSLRAARARALSEAARLMVLQNDQEQALALADESIVLWRQLDDPPGLASALFHRAWALHGCSRYEEARNVYLEALASISAEQDTWLYGQILLCLAGATGFTSDFEQARRYYERCRQLFAQIGDKSAIADAWKDQGGILTVAGECDEAISCLLTSIQICRELDHKQYIATALGTLSYAFGRREGTDPQAASLNSARVQGAAESLMATIGLNPWTETTPFIQAVRQHIRSRVDDASWQAAFDAGHALTLDQALEMVIDLAQSLA